MLCINGHELRADQKFCGICGSPAGPNTTHTEVNQPPAVQSVTPQQTCPHGVIITAGSNPCIYCSNPAPELDTLIQTASNQNFEIPAFKKNGDGMRKKIIAVATAVGVIAALIFGVNFVQSKGAPDYQSWTLGGLYKGDSTRINSLLNDACTRADSSLPDFVSSMDDTQSNIDDNYTSAFDVSTNFVDYYDTITRTAAGQALKAALSQDYSRLDSPSDLVTDIVKQMDTYCTTDPSLSDVSTQASDLDEKIHDINNPGSDWVPSGYTQDDTDPNYAWKWGQDKGEYYVTVNVINHQTCTGITDVEFGISPYNDGSSEIDTGNSYEYSNVDSSPQAIQLEYIDWYSEQQIWYSINQITCG